MATWTAWGARPGGWGAWETWEGPAVTPPGRRFRPNLSASNYPLPRGKHRLFRYFEAGQTSVGLLIYRNGTVVESKGPSLDQANAADDWQPQGGEFTEDDWQYDVLVDAGYEMVEV